MLVNVLGKLKVLVDEFAGNNKEHQTGDVKYHMGFSSDFQTDGGLVHLALAFNPSHLDCKPGCYRLCSCPSGQT